jgi:hypothetical protein
MVTRTLLAPAKAQVSAQAVAQAGARGVGSQMIGRKLAGKDEASVAVAKRPVPSGLARRVRRAGSDQGRMGVWVVAGVGLFLGWRKGRGWARGGGLELLQMLEPEVRVLGFGV